MNLKAPGNVFASRRSRVGALGVLGPGGRFSRGGATTLVIIVAFTGALVALMGLGNPPLPYRRGQVAKADVRSRVNFTLVDEDKTRLAREQAAAASPNVYRTDRSSLDQALSTFNEALFQIDQAENLEAMDEALAKSLGIGSDFFVSTKVALTMTPSGEITAAAGAALSQVMQRGFISDADFKQELSSGASDGIMVSKAGGLSYRKLTDLAKASDIRAIIGKGLAQALDAGDARSGIAEYLAVRTKPLLFYDEEQTQKLEITTKEAIEPVEHVVYRGDILARRDSVIDRWELAQLRKEHETYLAGVSARDRALRLTGLSITILLLVWVFGVFTRYYQPRVLERRTRMLILMALAVLAAAVARFFVRSSLSWYLIPLPLFAMSVAIAYDRLFALAYALALAALVGIAAGSDFSVTVSLFLGSAVGVFALGRVTSRPRPFLAGLAAGGGVLAAVWGTGLLFHTDYKLTFEDGLLGLANGCICGVLLTVLLPLLERGFNVVTDLSLLELADLNKPLLRRLALSAPGTYNHSLFVGNLADAAAEAIGANRLLARVGGYYHDIGKLAKPDYFVENHGTSASRHHNLSPTMSALVIISHVKDGIETARDIKLPSSVVAIIKEHHGTTLVEYFYREAVDKASDARSVSDQSFRYPGPRPTSKEAAIVMIADSVESASRTIDEPTAGRLEGLVVDIARRKLDDGQFDECGITMADLRKIELSLTKSLAGIFHSRIKYPGRQL